MVTKARLVVFISLVFSLVSPALFGNGAPASLRKVAAEFKDPSAQFLLGRMYETGLKVDKDLKEAAHWYYAAAKQGHLEAQVSLAKLYKDGRGVKQNDERAYSWFESASMNGDNEAIFQIGILHRKGVNGKIDKKKALLNLAKAAGNGHAQALFELGNMYNKGEGVKKDKKKATALWKRAQRGGYHPAKKVLSQNAERKAKIQKPKPKIQERLAVAKLEPGAFGAQTEGNFNKALTKVEEEPKKSFNSNTIPANPTNIDSVIKKISKPISISSRLRQIREKASKGDAASQYELGLLYKNGTEVNLSINEAVTWLEKAAYQNEAKAQLALGKIYARGDRRFLKDPPMAVSWYTKAAKLGSSEARYLLGKAYIDNFGVAKQSNEKGLQLIGTAAESGNTRALLTLANMYRYGSHTTKNIKRAIALYHKAALQGSDEAKNEYSTLFFSQSEQNKSDSELALNWLVNVAKRGHQEAQYLLANMFFNGKNVNISSGEAVKLLSSAASKGHREAQFSMGKKYYQGSTVAKNYQQSAAWFLKAAEQGHMEAQFHLGKMYKKGKGVQRSKNMSAKWYREAAKQGHAKARLILEGCISC